MDRSIVSRNIFLKSFITRVVFCVILFLSGSMRLSWSAEINKTLPSVPDLASELLETVVNISTAQTVEGTEQDENTSIPVIPKDSLLEEYFNDFFTPKEGEKNSQFQKVRSLGSGFVIDAQKGLIVTNYHVIVDADDIEVNFTDGTKLKAKLLGKDSKTDLALLQVDAGSKKLKAVRFGDSEKARIGDWVMAIGNPYGFGGSVTVGIISARNRDLNAGPYDNFIQTDAAINRGNSGGPLFDRNGEVIGINTAIVSPSGGSIGIGFAIPSDMALSIINQLRDFGEIRRGWLAIRIQPVTEDIAKSLKLENAVGALVAGKIEQTEKNNVDNSQLQTGDVILSFGNAKIKHARDLPRLVAESSEGRVVDVTILRNGQEKVVKVRLGRLIETDDNEDIEEEVDDKENNDLPKSVTMQLMGMTLSELTEDLRHRYSISDKLRGLVVTSVAQNSAADKKRIRVGEVIVDINQSAITTIDDAKKRFYKLREAGRKNVLLIVARPDGELRFVTIPID
ncbi:Do family serine endopeptidase [Bartonella krasnovii]|uniref:Probable periplasmic serine endoprotease DegP-like n=1 Tax=Bartonella krasnovii TaxID=2267275 RepID=A0A5B9D1G3_9HYPH|nr:Do family serine endopeptidase [Bartonella krasnovii]QEE12443.1 Do family serine endopeptidase [Bartonella krasnovii]UNF28538.1 Do family serine endopeptidase [Bartonella krasnovii]UNF34916.1 Do family serine endopeptidase [Bartonella krasnovii]UNF36553.1 Do family serine endopeptidase [Bartonella krasnovii]UNF38186.1 Do family serine endopeptidase [Bartonella krasnovii]